ncbi:hypothetical protein ANN_00272 [Periplaneta americana]|uniref:Uncharacterized protein n=1 Tax=Periplaneta americana TaxID=6978 RepID=A0ABQ8TRY8_PERAM|nr:hypothetical protein ANN_00272 [Periplaneta americana]
MGNACYYSVEKLLSSSLLSKNLKVKIYKTVILPVVLYGCETWTLTLREEQRLRVFENKVLRKIFGAKRDEVTGEWRKLHNAELHAPDIIRNIKSRRLRWAGHVARMGESRNAYRVLVGKPEGKRPLGRPRRRWEDNIKMDLREVEYDGRDWINLAQDRDQWRVYVRAAMNLRPAKMEHADLVAEMAHVEHLSTQERLHLARRRRLQQLKAWTQREKKWAGHKVPKSNKHIFFSDSVMLLEAAARNDIDEGKFRVTHIKEDHIYDNASEMSPGSITESYPAFARIGLRENPGKNLNQVTCPDRDSNPGHLVSRPDVLTVTPQNTVTSEAVATIAVLESDSITAFSNSSTQCRRFCKLERTAKVPGNVLHQHQYLCDLVDRIPLQKHVPAH